MQYAFAELMLGINDKGEFYYDSSVFFRELKSLAKELLPDNHAFQDSKTEDWFNQQVFPEILTEYRIRLSDRKPGVRYGLQINGYYYDKSFPIYLDFVLVSLAKASINREDSKQKDLLLGSFHFTLQKEQVSAFASIVYQETFKIVTP